MEHAGKILLVEDDKFSARMMELQFRKHGYAVRVAPSAEDGLALMEDESFDLILSDVMLPTLSGLEFLERIRHNHSRESLPVILLSSMEDVERMTTALGMGANDFIVKTKVFELILARVAPHVELARMRYRNQSPDQGGARISADGWWHWLVDKNQFYYSPGWKHILGFENEELGDDRQTWIERVHPEDLAELETALDSHCQRKQPCFDVDYRLRHKNGHFIWVHSFGVALFDKEGKPNRMIGSLCAITPLKKARTGVSFQKK